VRGCLITLLVLCSCGKSDEPTRSAEESVEKTKVAPPTASDYINIKKPPPRDRGLALLNPNDGGAFASLTGTSDFSSSGGVFVRRVETPDPVDAKRLDAVMKEEIESLQPCLNDRRLALLRPSEVEFQLDASGRATSLTLAEGQQVPCLTRWLEGLELGSPKAGKPVKVKLVLFVALE
jgi:hypothetical protein